MGSSQTIYYGVELMQQPSNLRRLDAQLSSQTTNASAPVAARCASAAH